MGIDPNRAKSIFLSAVEGHAPQEWDAYLDEACQGDTELRQRVEALLAAHRGADRLLDSPGAVLIGASDPAEPVEAPGTIVGRYKLLEKIGEGGMAVVYMAEQQEPIRRKVALKIIKLGMDTRQVIARFEAERQALALMDHPSIAKVFDAGATETGRPYFVMELVQGVSITEYCDKNSLSTKDRLALFVQVCKAVQHAHQKGIIHRDIKPSNVMVTHHDGKPIPKVIDFGIAKATNQRLTEKTLFTRYAHLIGTPAYMSPEQAELSDLDIDTRTDIYSLGVLLYELLTGTTPFSEEELRKAGYVEMQRVIREQEPVKPSTRIRTSQVARLPWRGRPAIACRGHPARDSRAGRPRHQEQGQDALATGRSTPYQQVRGDLDWIVMKALEKDRIRRYDTAIHLAEDIQRHLEQRPILARAPSTAYCLRKFLRRNRSRVIAVLTIMVIAGIVVLSYVRGQQQARLAEAQATRETAILSEARRLIEKGAYAAARQTLRPILESTYTGLEARGLFAGIMVDGRGPDESGEGVETIMEKHYRERARYYTEKVEAGPDDANSYLQRSQQYYYLGREDETNDDVRRYATIVTKGTFTGFRFSRPKNLGRDINTWTQEFPLWLTNEGLSLWFHRGNMFIEVSEGFVATRATRNDSWGTPVSVGLWSDPSTFKAVGVIPGVTTGDGLEMFISDIRPGGHGSYDIWEMKRPAIGANCSEPVNLDLPVNSENSEYRPTISLDGLELYFSDFPKPRPGGWGRADIWVTRRASRNGTWGEPSNLGPTVNSASRDHTPLISPDGLSLFFASDRPGGYGGCDIWVTRRAMASASAPWGPPVNLGPSVNTSASELTQCISGNTLYFASTRPGGYGGYDIWEVQILAPGSDSEPNNSRGSPDKAAESDAGKEVVAEQNH
jgi:serine/threonine protein kinase